MWEFSASVDLMWHQLASNRDTLTTILMCTIVFAVERSLPWPLTSVWYAFSVNHEVSFSASKLTDGYENNCSFRTLRRGCLLSFQRVKISNNSSRKANDAAKNGSPVTYVPSSRCSSLMRRRRKNNPSRTECLAVDATEHWLLSLPLYSYKVFLPCEIHKGFTSCDPSFSHRSLTGNFMNLDGRSYAVASELWLIQKWFNRQLFEFCSYLSRNRGTKRKRDR